MPSKLDATLVVPTYDRAPVLAHTLPRWLEQTLGSAAMEIILVDDGSPNDETAALIGSMGDAPILLLRQARAGSSSARNLAIRHARGRILIFLDDDAFVGPHFVARHLAMHRHRHPRLVAGGIIQVREMPVVVDESPGLRAFHRHPMPGGNASAPTEAVRHVGGYDPWFSAYGWQDQELGERLLASGLRRRFAWGAPIQHYKPPAYDVDLRSLLARESDRGRMGARFYYKHPRATIGIATKVGPTIHALVELAGRVFGICDLQKQAESGALDGVHLPSWRGALLRAHVESNAGVQELQRIRRDGVESPP